MKKLYSIIYCSILAFSFCLFIYIYFYEANENTRQYHSYNCITTWNDYSQKFENNTSVITGTIQNTSDNSHLFAFYSTHQHITVYHGTNMIYQFPLDNMNPISKTPGYNWNVFTLPDGEIPITIYITSPYSSYVDAIPTFYIGNTISIMNEIISANIISFIICLIILCFGLCMVAYWLYIRLHVPIKSNLLQLGLFSVVLALWSANECQFAALLFRYNLVCSYVSFIVLMLMPIPFVLFVKSYYDDTNKIWDIFCIIDLLQIITCFVLQFLKIADFRETLWTTHIMLLLVAVIIISRSIMLLKKELQEHTVTIHLCCLFICMATLLLDLFNYYQMRKDSNMFGRIGFLIYIVVLGITSMKDSAALMKLGRKAHKYEQLAYTDQMTTLSNRTAFQHDFEILSSSPDNIAIINLDLNSLKYINDNLGHTFGDTYITNSAQIISKIFGHVGKCYRVGGDEFVVIIEQASHFDFTYYFNMLDWSIDTFNRGQTGMPVPMQIAHGYAIYDSSLDKNLHDTYNRADKDMYANKKEKKRTRSQT